MENVIPDCTEGETLPLSPDSTGIKRKPWNFLMDASPQLGLEWHSCMSMGFFFIDTGDFPATQSNHLGENYIFLRDH